MTLARTLPTTTRSLLLQIGAALICVAAVLLTTVPTLAQSWPHRNVRFIDHDGGQKNQPALRFGNVSMNPTPIRQDNGVEAEAYCIDLHSRSGYSG